MPATPRLVLAAGLLLVPVVGCEMTGDGATEPVPGQQAQGGGDAEAEPDQEAWAGDVAVEDAPAAVVVLRDGVQVAPGTEVIPPGVGETGSGWYVALDLDDTAPSEVAGFYREQLAALGFAVEPTAALTVVASRPTGPTTRVRVDVVPASGEVPGFVRLLATA